MELFIAAAAVGVIVGILSGMLGIGGGAIMVPVNRLVFGMSAIEATATSLFTIIPTSLTGCITHIRNRTCVVPLGLSAGLAGACTSSLGVYLANISPSWLIMVIAALVISISAYNMIKKAIALPKDGSVKRMTKQEAEQQIASEAYTGTLGTAGAVKGALIGLGAGLASGYVGVGGAFIMVPLFISVLGVSMKHASGTSLIAVTILAIPGSVEQALLGNVHFTAGIAMAVGSIPGAYVGAQLIKYIPEKRLRFIFSGVLLFAAIMLVVNEVVAV